MGHGRGKRGGKGGGGASSPWLRPCSSGSTLLPSPAQGEPRAVVGGQMSKGSLQRCMMMCGAWAAETVRRWRGRRIMRSGSSARGSREASP